MWAPQDLTTLQASAPVTGIALLLLNGTTLHYSVLTYSPPAEQELLCLTDTEHLRRNNNNNNNNNSSVILIREQTIRTELPPLLGEVGGNFCWLRDVAWLARQIPYGSNLAFLERSRYCSF
jgi:hypothetical protein